MLVLDDAAFARVVIAATGVPQEERRRWLADVGTRLEQGSSAPTPSRGSRYTREWRARARNGETLLKVKVDEAAFAVAAVERGLLDPLLADDRGALNAAAVQALVLFVRETSQPHAGIRAKLSAGLIAAAQRSADGGEGRRLRPRDEGRARAPRQRGR